MNTSRVPIAVRKQHPSSHFNTPFPKSSITYRANNHVNRHSHIKPNTPYLYIIYQKKDNKEYILDLGVNKDILELTARHITLVQRNSNLTIHTAGELYMFQNHYNQLYSKLPFFQYFYPKHTIKFNIESGSVMAQMIDKEFTTEEIAKDTTYNVLSHLYPKYNIEYTDEILLSQKPGNPNNVHPNRLIIKSEIPVLNKTPPKNTSETHYTTYTGKQFLNRGQFARALTSNRSSRSKGLPFPMSLPIQRSRTPKFGAHQVKKKISKASVRNSRRKYRLKQGIPVNLSNKSKFGLQILRHLNPELVNEIVSHKYVWNGTQYRNKKVNV